MAEVPRASDVRATLRPRPLVEALVRHRVDFIVLGGIAERLLGVPRTTDDFDICPAMGRANLERLAGVLNDVGAIWRPEGMEKSGFPIAGPWSARSFGAHTSLSLLTKFGPFDIWPRPDGSEGYDDLIRKAVEVTIGDDSVKLIHLEDSIRIKRTIGGPKYLGHIDLLRETQEQRRARGLD